METLEKLKNKNNKENIVERPIPYLPHTNEDRFEMFKSMGIESIEDLVKGIPDKLRNFDLDLPPGKSEIEINQAFNEYAKRNKSLNEQASFIGGGVYNRFIPSVVEEVLSKGDFYTAYTPYQPEVSQGTLQAIYEFQTLICNLTGMDSANASVYDGATAVIEAALMACRVTKRKKILVSRNVYKEAQEICKTYAWGTNLEIDFIDFNPNTGITDLEELKSKINSDVSCYILSYPNFAGCIEPINEISKIVKENGSLLIGRVDLISLALLKSPRELGIDITVGDGQSLGNYINYGGPHVGFISCIKEYTRQLPGRIVGLSIDSRGQRAFTLTLQTREQHIRRQNATSNICTNQSLNALAVLVYLTYMGPYGLKKIAEISLKRAHYLAEELVKISNKEGKKLKLSFNSPYFNEFVLELPIQSIDFINKLKEKNILPGLDLNQIPRYKTNQILVTVTEMNSVEQVNYFVESVKKIFS